MVNRENYHAVKAYLAYLSDVQQRDAKTVDRAWVALRHLLEWADARRLSNLRDKAAPAFPRYLAERGLSHESIKRSCITTRALFAWLKENHPQRYSRITDTWLETLRPPRQAEQPTEHQAYTVDEVRAICQLEALSLGDMRDQAAAAFLFLSGMRVTAFTTLPVNAVDLKHMTVKQFPEMGVRTKNLKRATTYLLNIPELLDVCRAWDLLVRHTIGPDGLWFAPLTNMGQEIAATGGNDRRGSVTRGLKILCARAHVEYKSPHKLRHGHALYAIKRAQAPADLKAISQNLMHSDLKTTDRVYGILRDDDVRERIVRLKGAK